MANRNMMGFMVGCVGAVLTLSAYHQTVVSSTECVVGGFFVLIFGLLIKEGFIPL